VHHGVLLRLRIGDRRLGRQQCQVTIRIIEVWDTREQAEAFGEKVRAAREEMSVGGPMPPVEYLELHALMTPQQAPA
jgi:hypothetical protein